MNLRYEWCLAYDGEPMINGQPHRVEIGRFYTRADATNGYNAMRNRGKDNLRIEVRQVTEWQAD